MLHKEEKIVAAIKAMEKEREADFDAQNKVVELKWGNIYQKQPVMLFRLNIESKWMPSFARLTLLPRIYCFNVIAC